MFGPSYGFPGSWQGFSPHRPDESLPASPEEADSLFSTDTPGSDRAIEQPPGAAAPAGPPFRSLAELLAAPLPELRWVVEGLLLDGGMSLLAAKPKVGKSTLARVLAVSVARGAPFLERQTVAGPVLHLALEEHSQVVLHHFQAMGAVDAPVYVCFGPAPEQALGWFEARIVAHRPRLVIVDPLFKLIRLPDANDYAQVSRAFEPLIALARRHNCHILCVHHLGKSDRAGADAILGSTALFGAVDNALLLKRRDNTRLITTHPRIGPELPETVISLDPATGLVVCGGASRGDGDDLAARVLAVCTTPMTEPEIQAAVRGNRTLIGAALRALVAQGALFRTGSGQRGSPYRYQPPDFSIAPLFSKEGMENRETHRPS